MVEIDYKGEKLIWGENFQSVIDWVSKELKVGMNVQIFCTGKKFSILSPDFESDESPIDSEIIVDNSKRAIVSNYSIIWDPFEFDDWWDENKYIVRVWDTITGKTNWLDLDTWNFIWVSSSEEASLFSMVWDIQEINWLRYFIANSSRWNCLVLLDSNPIWYIVWWVYFQENNIDFEEINGHLFVNITIENTQKVWLAFPEWTISDNLN